ncbi:hypothetical protein P167DRAFT_539925 [Morchella conica CCBAS932]|uniref:Uncharacterized protein n=1 Tax=Morchella conica CCBAS932 TaxID=1392247 RepID=A0A3N4KAZ6_9PEZI|nr:hypothetical protein P167DRAFT_539925 [Morchella conica CCBAS932]
MGYSSRDNRLSRKAAHHLPVLLYILANQGAPGSNIFGGVTATRERQSVVTVTLRCLTFATSDGGVSAAGPASRQA